jgi:hypothetical protein
MSLALYAAKCDDILQELLESLSDADIEALRTDCATLGVDGLKHWGGDNLELIEQYVRATPSQRNRKKEWQKPVLRRRLVLTGIHYVTFAKKLLAGIDEYMLYPGLSYRDTAANAGRAFHSIFQGGVDPWPFSGDDPFA